MWGGRALVVGFAGGEIEKVRGDTSRVKTQLAQQLRWQLPLNLVLLKNVSVLGIYWGSYQSATRHLSPFTTRFTAASREQTHTCQRGLDGTPRTFRLRSSETGSVQWSLHSEYA